VDGRIGVVPVSPLRGADERRTPAGPAILATLLAVALWPATLYAQGRDGAAWPADSLAMPDSLTTLVREQPAGEVGWAGWVAVLTATMMLVFLFHRRSS
jgi:hypothetical protein